MPFKQFLFEWQNFYTGMAAHLQGSYVKPGNDQKIKDKNKKKLIYNDLKISPDGTKIVYTDNNNGRFTLKLRDLETNSEETIFKGGYQVVNQKVDYEMPLVNWADDNTIGIISYLRGKNVFWLYDIPTKSKLPTSLERLDQIKSFDFNTNGRLAIMSADINGQNDLYLLSVRRGRTRRLTNDLYDDIDPSFIPNSNIIAFSSNRISDTLDLKVDSYKDINSNYNIYLFNLDTTNRVLTRITNTISKDVKPIAKSPYEIYYLSDQKGIQNIFKYSLTDSLYSQVSNFSLSIKNFDINFDNNQLAFVLSEFDHEYIYYQTGFNPNRVIFTPLSRRQEAVQAKFIAERRRIQLEESSKSEPIKVDIDEEEAEDIEDDDDFIDTDNYVFETDLEERFTPETESFLSQYRRLQTGTSMVGPFPYETKFSADNLVTSWLIDPLRGFGIQIETQMNDILENHRFYGGFMATTDFKSGDVFAEYQYLKGLIDYSFRYDRKVVFWPTVEGNSEKYSRNIIEVGGALPINSKSRVSFTPFVANTRFEDLDPNLLSNGVMPTSPTSSNIRYMGFRTEYIYDNSNTKGMNLIDGTRGKITFQHWEALNNKNRSFSNISIDFRNYQKIHRELVFATRVFYGKYLGRNPQQYVLGGMDNWLFNNTNFSGTGNSLNTQPNQDNSDILFTDFVTPMRGFDYATFFGTETILFNAELRFPVIKYFYRGPISSNFFRNLQFIAFYDVGSAWTGKSPFSGDDNLNTEIIDRGSIFRAEIRNFRSPWLQSYGTGLRTVMLGFYMKFDLAWPIVDYEVQRIKFHATLGFDF